MPDEKKDFDVVPGSEHKDGSPELKKGEGSHEDAPEGKEAPKPVTPPPPPNKPPVPAPKPVPVPAASSKAKLYATIAFAVVIVGYLVYKHFA